MTHKLQLVEHRNSNRKRLRRRAFVQALGVATSALLSSTLTSGCKQETGPNEPPQPDAEQFDLPTLGGAPDTPQGRTVAAFVDTVIPGKHRDPEGAVGGIDVGAPGLFFDPELPALPFVGVLVLVLDANTSALHQLPRFADATPSQRDQVVAQCLQETEVFAFAVQLAKLAYFASEPAAAHLGYPGPNDGYVNDADFGFGMPMAQEMTADGNLP